MWYTPALKSRRTSPKPPAYQSVSRIRAELNIGTPRRHQHISLPPARLQQFLAVRIVDLPAQPSHVDLDEIRKLVKAFIPDVLCNLTAADDLSGVSGQVFHKGEFLCCQLNKRRTARHASSTHIDREVCHMDDLGMNGRLTPQEGPNAGQKLAEIERLDEV